MMDKANTSKWLAHLLGRDSYDVLANTAQPILNSGLSYLQDSALLVLQNNIDAKNDKDIEHEGLLVPQKAFINSYAEPFKKFFMTELIDWGYANQKVFVDSLQWKRIDQTGHLLYNPTTKEILGVSWQNIDREEVKKEFRNGGVLHCLA
jgi:hypothetical protein